MKLLYKTSFVIIILLPMMGWSHARLKSPVPRNDSSGIKTGPCGDLAKSGVPTPIQTGSTVTVSFEETINHPGRYRISLLNPSDQTITMLKEIVDDQNGAVDFNSPATYHQYSTQVTMPTTECVGCSIQMIQVMEENPAVPSFYYSCADVNIKADITGEPKPTPFPGSSVPNDVTEHHLVKSPVESEFGCVSQPAASSSLLVFFISLFLRVGFRRRSTESPA